MEIRIALLNVRSAGICCGGTRALASVTERSLRQNASKFRADDSGFSYRMRRDNGTLKEEKKPASRMRLKAAPRGERLNAIVSSD